MPVRIVGGWGGGGGDQFILLRDITFIFYHNFSKFVPQRVISYNEAVLIL